MQIVLIVMNAFTYKIVVFIVQCLLDNFIFFHYLYIVYLHSRNIKGNFLNKTK